MLPLLAVLHLADSDSLLEQSMNQIRMSLLYLIVLIWWTWPSWIGGWVSTVA